MELFIIEFTPRELRPKKFILEAHEGKVQNLTNGTFRRQKDEEIT